MLTVYRIAKAKHAFDTLGAYLEGGRWNSPGGRVIYGSSCLAGCLLEVLVQAGRRQKLPGTHHCARAHIPDDVPVEVVDETQLAGWEVEGSAAARDYGDGWLRELRTAVLSVPAVTAKPYGRHLLLNPNHADWPRIRLEQPVAIIWDARLFSI
ncbi:MAG: RES domain-containing protein [Gemmatimonadetes bacterium]|nr:RES domain-containing protein [Gemmatimonadota bacterium]